jgi:hypothetical protein
MNLLLFLVPAILLLAAALLTPPATAQKQLPNGFPVLTTAKLRQIRNGN